MSALYYFNMISPLAYLWTLFLNEWGVVNYTLDIYHIYRVLSKCSAHISFKYHWYFRSYLQVSNCWSLWMVLNLQLGTYLAKRRSRMKTLLFEKKKLSSSEIKSWRFTLFLPQTPTPWQFNTTRGASWSSRTNLRAKSTALEPPAIRIPLPESPGPPSRHRLNISCTFIDSTRLHHQKSLLSLTAVRTASLLALSAGEQPTDRCDLLLQLPAFFLVSGGLRFAGICARSQNITGSSSCLALVRLIVAFSGRRQL